jgi:hypothetical protein
MIIRMLLPVQLPMKLTPASNTAPIKRDLFLALTLKYFIKFLLNFFTFELFNCDQTYRSIHNNLHYYPTKETHHMANAILSKLLKV